MKMNNTLYIGAAALILLASGCSDSFDVDGNLEPSLTGHFLRPSEIMFESDASAFTRNFKVDSYTTPWRFSGEFDWFSLTPGSGQSSSEVVMTGEENVSVETGRTAIFYLESTDEGWNYNRAMSVSQEKAMPFLTTDLTMLEFGGSAGSQTINVTSNCKWAADCSETWVTLAGNSGSGHLTVSVSANPTDEYRRGTAYIRYGENMSVAIGILQSPSSISVSDYTLEYDYVASGYDVTIESEAEWSSSASDSWIYVNPSQAGAGRTKVAIEVSANFSTSDRSGNVYIRTGDTERLQIKVHQAGMHLDTTPSRLEYSHSSETKTISISSNMEWEVLTAPNWLTFSKTSGKGNAEISVTASENNNMAARNGEITIGHAGFSMTKTISVTQEGKTFDVDAATLEFTDKCGTLAYSLHSNASWTSAKSADWFAVSPDNGLGDATIGVTAEENLSTEERFGTITYDCAGNQTMVNVHQLAKYLTIDNESFSFGSRGGTHTIELSTNYKWAAYVEHDVEWLKLSATSGEGDAAITLTAGDNASVNVRSTAVVVNPDGYQSIRILVTQMPRYLNVSTQGIQFFDKGGISDDIFIDTDGSYEIIGDSSWFVIERGEGDSFKVVATENKSDRSREGKITISLTDLVEGSLAVELSVMQAAMKGTLITEEYPGTDMDWDNIGRGSLNITIEGYAADKYWDAHGYPMTVNVTGFSIDRDWNRNDPYNGRTTITLYGVDKDWNEGTTASGNPGINGFDGESNWDDSTTASSGNPEINGYGYETDWDNSSTTSSGSPTVSGYGDEINWDNVTE